MSIWGKSNPDEEFEPRVHTHRVGLEPARSRLVIVSVVLVLGVGLLWVKPWDRASTTTAALASQQIVSTVPPTATEPADLAPIAGRATPRPTMDAATRLAVRPRHCFAPREWRLLSSESTLRLTTRTRWAASPAVAQGPADPNLPLRVVHAETLKAVGICPPRTPVMSATKMLSAVVLWQVLPNGTTREVIRPEILDVQLYDEGEAYFAPPAGEGPYWPEGRYVFEIKRMEGPGSRWIGLEFSPTRA